MDQEFVQKVLDAWDKTFSGGMNETTLNAFDAFIVANYIHNLERTIELQREKPFEKSTIKNIQLRRQRELLLDSIRQIQTQVNELDRAFRNEFPELEFTKILREIALRISGIAKEALG